jgi:hypothetical protein
MPESILEITRTDLVSPIIEIDNQIVDIEIDVPVTPRGAYRSTNNLVDAQSRQTSEENNTRNRKYEAQNKALILVYMTVQSVGDALCHTFVLSIFETIFFWSYISVQEDKALRKNLFQLQNIVTEMCNQYDITSAISIEDLVKVDSRSREEHNQDLLNTSIFLCLALLASVLSGTFICAMIPREDQKSGSGKKYISSDGFKKRWAYETGRSLSKSILPIATISIYEILFFQTVVKLYMPISTEEVYIDLFDKCF